MIEALKELVTIIKDLPDMALWILGGFLFYKLAIWGSAVGAIAAILKLAINRFHSYKDKITDFEIEKEKQKEIQKKYKDESAYINGVCFSIDGSADEFKVLLRQIIKYRNPQHIKDYFANPEKQYYLNITDVLWLKEIVENQMDKEMESKDATK